jgi:hypothetical protein
MAIQLLIMALNFLRRGSMKGQNSEKPSRGSAIKNLTWGEIVRLVMRFFQFVMGIVIIGLYAQDLTKAVKLGAGRDPKWMFATITGAIAAIWAVGSTFFRWWFFFFMDFAVFLLYLIAFGIFGKMYLKEDPEGNKGIIRMKHAVWIQLVNVFLWLITASYGAFIFWKSKKATASQHIV